MSSPAGTRRGRTAAMLAALTPLFLAIVLAGCGRGTGRLVDDPPPEVLAAPANASVTQVGQWSTAADGLAFSVTGLRRGTVPADASGGRPGGPAVIVTLQFRNGSEKRFDLALVRVVTRMGAQGSEAEEVFTSSYQGNPDGTLAPGRSATVTHMFAASKTSELDDVAVEVKPGIEYDKVSFAGKA